MRTCKECLEVLPDLEFYGHTTKDGLRSECKRCHIFAASERRRLQPERTREYGREQSRRYRASSRWSPKRARARKEVSRAKKRGDIVSGPCVRCGSFGRVEAHHHLGYSEEHWLDVIWLCARCHKGVDRTTRDDF